MNDTEHEKQLKRIKGLSLIMFGFVIFFGIMLSLVYVIIAIGDEVQDIQTASMLEHHILTNNLEVPIPYSYSNNLMPIATYNESVSDILLRTHFHDDIDKFKAFINDNYYYSLNEYDCKYWAYVWTLYAQETKNIYNFNIEYVTLSKHVFVVLSNDEIYCIADGNLFNCYTLSYK